MSTGMNVAITVFWVYLCSAPHDTGPQYETVFHDAQMFDSVNPHYDALLLRLVFDGPQGANGIDPGTAGIGALPGDIPAPTVQWWNADPLGSSGVTSHVFAAAGTPGSADTPFCPTGDHSDLSSGCMTAAVLSADTVYYSTAAVDDVGIHHATDLTICSAWNQRGDQASNHVLFGLLDQVSAEGVRGSALGSGTQFYCYATTSGGGVTSNVAKNCVGAWCLACCSVDYGTSVTAYLNGTSGTPSGWAAGTVETPQALVVGGRQLNLADSEVTGRVAFQLAWDQALTSSQLDAFYGGFIGALDGGLRYDLSYANTGPTSCWIDGMLEGFGDDFLRKGCEMPPGTAQAGDGSDCPFIQATLTNSLTYSRLLTTGWTAVGTSVVSTSTASWFRDGRQLYKITDDDGASHEYLHQTVAKGGATTAAIVVTAATESGSGTVTIGVEETTGGTCSTPAETTTTVATSTSVTTSLYAVTFADANCTDVRINVYPVDTSAGVSATGHAAATVELYHDADYQPASYIETEAAAVSAGDDVPEYAVSNPLVDASGSMAGQYRIEVDVTRYHTSGAGSGNEYVLSLSDGTTNNRFLLFTDNSAEMNWFTAPGGQDITTTTLSWMPGTQKRLVFVGSYDTDVWTLSSDGVVVGSSTTARASPTGLSEMQIGSANTGSYQPKAGAAICGPRIWR